jgi:hypothetical protein
LHRSDLGAFVETGLTNVVMRSAAFDLGSGALNRLPSGRTVTGTLAIVNPKSFDVSYTLSWDVDDSLFASAPPTSPVSSDPARLSISFVLDPSTAEHKTIAFSLGMYVAAINKTYDDQSFSIQCDSPPNPAQRLATLMDSGQKSLLAILLPREISDDDLARISVTWSREGETAGATAIYDLPSLSTVPASNPFASAYDCYFQSADCVAGYGYSYAVTLIDAVGQQSSAVSTSSTANVFYLNYDGNGNTGGAAPDSVGYRYGATATIADAGDLAKTDHAFYRWNTTADGAGTSYSPGDELTIPAGEVRLYAIWVTNINTITFDLGGTQGLSFSAPSMIVARGATLAVSCANPTLATGGTDWKWYVDGVQDMGQTSSSFDFMETTVGQYIISCTVSYQGIGHSGSFRATVTQ